MVPSVGGAAVTTMPEMVKRKSSMLIYGPQDTQIISTMLSGRSISYSKTVIQPVESVEGITPSHFTDHIHMILRMMKQ